jgi:hypothetical protein
MAIVKTDNQHYSNIAAAIRNKKGVADTYTPSAMAAAIASIQTATEPYIEYVFNTDNLVQSAYAHGIPYICENMFYGNYAMTSLRIPSNITFVGIDAFTQCYSLQQLIIDCIDVDSQHPLNDLSTIRANILTEISTITEVVLIGATTVPMNAFSGCVSLSQIIIPEGVLSIDGFAFLNCTGLATINLPSTITAIVNGAFDGCTNLLTINVPWAEGAVEGAPWGAGNATINYNYTGE